jgi:hypothetical protein
LFAVKTENTKRFSPGLTERFLSGTLVLAAALFFVLGCSPSVERGAGSVVETSDGAPADDVLCYIFEGGSLTAIEDIRRLPEGDRKPWTRQVRVVDARRIGNELYCAVNGIGVFIFSDIFAAGGELQYKTISHSDIFDERTIGSFFFYDSTLFCHLYSDSVLSSEKPSSQPIALLSIDPEDNLPKIIPFSFQDRNPGWELALLSPQPDGLWSLAWKYSSEEKTMFRYSDLDVKAWAETEITEEEFLNNLMPLDEASAPQKLKKAAHAAFGTGERAEQPVVVDISVQNSRAGTRQTYRFGPSGALRNGEGRYELLDCFEDRGVFYLLLPQGEIIFINSEGEDGEFRLPSLPPGFVYTGFVTDGRKIIAFWEEQDFTLVGSAGILIHNPECLCYTYN